MKITKNNNEVEAILNEVQHDYQCLIFWKQQIGNKIEYGFTVCNDNDKNKKYQLDYDTFTRNEIVELIKNLVELVKE